MNNFFKSAFIFSCAFSFLFGAEDHPYLKYWQKIFDEEKPLERPGQKGWEYTDRVKTFNEYDGKKILAFVREGDYTHAGEEEAIDLIMSYFPEDKNNTILDVACGLGGTASYMYDKGYKSVVGFDIEKEAIDYARTTYPKISFFVSDVAAISNSDRFDIICIVNSFVCFPEQKQCLKELLKLAKPTTKLIILEYTDLMESGKNPFVGKGKKASFLPIRPGEIEGMANECGWQIERCEMLDSTFQNWYRSFLDRIESKREIIDEKFGNNATNYLRGKYDLIHYGLVNHWIGGCILVLSPKPTKTQ